MYIYANIHIGKYNGMDLNKLAAKMYEEYGEIVRIKGLPQKPDMVFIYNFDGKGIFLLQCLIIQYTWKR